MHSHMTVDMQSFAWHTASPLSLALPRLDTVTDREPFRFSIKFMASKSHERLPHRSTLMPHTTDDWQLAAGNWQLATGNG